MIDGSRKTNFVIVFRNALNGAIGFVIKGGYDDDAEAPKQFHTEDEAERAALDVPVIQAGATYQVVEI